MQLTSSRRLCLMLLTLLPLLAPFMGMAQPRGGRPATAWSRLERLSEPGIKARGLTFDIPLKSQKRLKGSAGYVMSRRGVQAQVGYHFRKEISYTSGSTGAILPLSWGVRGRIERSLFGLSPRDWIGVQFPVGTQVELHRRLFVMVEVAPGVNLRSLRPVPDLDARMGLSLAF